MQAQQESTRRNAAERLAALPEWHELASDEREWSAAQLGSLAKTVEPSLEGLRELLNHDYTVNHQIRELESTVRTKAAEHKQSRQAAAEAAAKAGKGPAPAEDKSLILPAVIESEPQLESLVKTLTEFLNTFRAGQRLRVTCQLQHHDAARKPTDGR
jgi:septum formation inhibitor MinC